MNHMLVYFDICRISAEKGKPVTAGELKGQWTGIPKSTLHRYIAQLIVAGLVVRVKRGLYLPSKNEMTNAIIKLGEMS